MNLQEQYRHWRLIKFWPLTIGDVDKREVMCRGGVVILAHWWQMLKWLVQRILRLGYFNSNCYAKLSAY